MAKRRTTSPKRLPESPVVIGVGASAGGLEALQEFLSHVPDALQNVSIIITQHLSPSYKSMLVQLLSRSTKREVVEITTDMAIEPDIVYITPPDHELVVKDGRLYLNKSTHVIGPKPSVDAFFTSLASERKKNCVGVILSGTGSDGANGIRAIKKGGGLTVVQEPHTAKYDGMPISAIRTEAVDLVLAPERMGDEIATYLTNPSALALSDAALFPSHDAMTDILNMLSKRTSTDFSRYKQSTIVRRLEKRLSLLHITTLDDYVKFVKENPAELDQLFQTVLIGVTEFFRDPEAFAILEKMLGEVIAKKEPNEPVRIWVCGCATGEEAYTIAMVIAGILKERIGEYHVQIFATDIDEKALDTARRGVFPAASLERLPSRIVKSFFKKQSEGQYEISKSIRSMILFSKHDVTANPPFMKLDLVSCRNMLIYLNTDLQKYILSLFHYALAIDGLLFLGKSETVGQYGDLFGTLDGTAKVFRRAAGGRTKAFALSYFQPTRSYSADAAAMRDKARMSVGEMVKETLFKTYEHPFVIINETFEIQEIYGDVRLVLNLGEGVVNINILRLIDKQLNLELHAILTKAVKDRVPTKGKIRSFEFMGKPYFVKIVVKPLLYTQQSSELFIVVFEFYNGEEDALLVHPAAGQDVDPRIEELEKELRATREHLQTYVEELETTNEELQSLNEELQSTNEELQSSNEELETSNEELQSTNEELQTAYMELKQLNSLISAKDEKLKKSEAHLHSLINNMPEGMILLGTDLRVLIFNRSSARMFRENFGKQVREGTSIMTLMPKEAAPRCSGHFDDALDGRPTLGIVLEAANTSGKRTVLRTNIIPVVNDDRRTVSIIVHCTDMTQHAQVHSKLAMTERMLATVFRTAPYGICLTDAKGIFVDFNDAYRRMYGFKRAELLGQHFTVVVPPKDRKQARALHDAFIEKGKEPPAEWTVRRKDGRLSTVQVTATLLRNEEGAPFKLTSVHPADR